MSPSVYRRGGSCPARSRIPRVRWTVAATAAAHGRTSVTIAADQTHLPPDIYATVQYRYVLPAPVVAPNTGDGTSAAHAHRTPLALALGAMALACAALAGGFLLKRR